MISKIYGKNKVFNFSPSEFAFGFDNCKKLNLEDLGYSCSDLESQTASRIDKIKGK